jgi:hypothetical protein
MPGIASRPSQTIRQRSSPQCICDGPTTVTPKPKESKSSTSLTGVAPIATVNPKPLIASQPLAPRPMSTPRSPPRYSGSMTIRPHSTMRSDPFTRTPKASSTGSGRPEVGGTRRQVPIGLSPSHATAVTPASRRGPLASPEEFHRSALQNCPGHDALVRETSTLDAWQPL